MPITNRDQCYKYIFHAFKKADQWKLSVIVDAMVSFIPELTKENAENNLLTHVGEESAYAHKSDLIETLKIIQTRLEDLAVSEGEKHQITIKLNEEITECSPGFHVRCNSILLSLQRPQNIDDFLKLIRTDIVEKVASRNVVQLQGLYGVYQVHRYNDFFNYASEQYGLLPLMENDRYRKELSEVHKNALDVAFVKEYSAFAIFTQLIDKIQDELRNYYGYEGYQEDGYGNGVYVPILEILKKILGEGALDYEQLLLCDDEGRICDVRWDVIWFKLWEKLIVAQYLEYTEEEKTLLSGLENKNYKKIDKVLARSKNHNDVFLVLLYGVKKKLTEEQSPEEKRIFISNFFPLLISLKKRFPLWQPLFEKVSFIRVIFSFFDKDEHFFNWKILVGCAWIKSLLEEQDKNKESLSLLSIKIDTMAKKLIEQQDVFSLDMLLRMDYSKNNIRQVLQEISMMISSNFLPYSTKAAIWIAKNKEGWTALMLAIRHHPEIVSDLVAAMNLLLEATRAAIWKAKNQEGWSALMLAIRRHPKSVPEMLASINALPEEARVDIWKSQTKEGWNLLMLAAEHCPEVIPDVLVSINGLPELARIAVLENQNKEKWNALMIATRHYSSIFSHILGSINLLPEPARIAILESQNQEGWNILMIAARYDQKIVSDMLPSINILPESTRKTILISKNKEGWNVFLLVARYHPKIINDILVLINTLQENVRVAIWETQNKDGWTALMLAARNQSDVVPDMLASINLLPEATRIAFWRAKTFDEGINFLQVLDKYSSEELMQQVIDNYLLKFSCDEQEQMLSVFQPVTTALQKYKRDYLAIVAGDLLSEDNETEKSIKNYLSSMWFNAESKQSAILTEIKKLKADYPEDEKVLQTHLVNENSALAKKMQIKRYSLGVLFG